MLLLKVFSIIWWKDKRHYVRFALKWDKDWSRHLRRSWKRRRYWVQGQGHRRAYRGQILDLVIEWRVGRKF